MNRVGHVGLFVWTALQLEPDSRLTESIPPNSETAQGVYHADKVFGGFMPALMLVEWSEDETFDSPVEEDLLLGKGANLEFDVLTGTFRGFTN